MAIDLNDEILQDFLVEAGEILEQLSEQLVDLEQSPEDSNLLNSIFRGFHTIKGGGSFLSLTNLVEVCHKSEDVFDLLRNQKLTLDAKMMDVFLQVLDEANRMFAEIREGIDPGAVSAELLQQLLQMQTGEPVVVEAAAEPEAESESKSKSEGSETSGTSASEAMEAFVGGTDEISDDEFESLLDTLKAQPPGEKEEVKKEETKPDASTSDEITDDEFETLLDNLKDTSSDSKAEVKPNTPAKAEPAKEAAPAKKVTPKLEAEKPKAASKKPEPAKAAGPKATPAETTVRVDTSRLDDIMNLVGELVLARNRLNTLKESFEDERVHQAISNLDVVTGDLQTAVMKTRMQPVKKVFGRFPRVVRDLARSLKKEVSLEMRGEETDLDKNLVEALADPLVHLVRNSVDHGVELPDIREAAGKSREGTVILAAQQEGDHIILSITDDGAGMDPDVLRNNAVEKGLMDAETASRLNDKECFDLIFMPGLSTKEQITDVSGRGVGMDVVKTKITQLNGTIDIESELGKGTVLSIKVPLTLAILPTLMVELDTRKFALPLSNVSEIFELSSKETSIVDGREVVLNRGKAPPVFYLRDWLLNGKADPDYNIKESQVIMVQVANTHVGLVVDQVVGQEEVVIKPLGALLHGLPGMAGSTITGDGDIAIIIDVPGLLKKYA